MIFIIFRVFILRVDGRIVDKNYYIHTNSSFLPISSFACLCAKRTNIFLSILDFILPLVVFCDGFFIFLFIQEIYNSFKRMFLKRIIIIQFSVVFFVCCLCFCYVFNSKVAEAAQKFNYTQSENVKQLLNNYS